MADDTKTCPMCAETVKAAAARCRFCGYDFIGMRMPAAASSPPQSKIHSAIDAWVDGPNQPKRERGSLGCGGAAAIMIAGLAIALYAVWPSDEEMDAKRDATLASAAHELVSPKEFARAYSDNEVAAEARFAGKVIEMRGKVTRVGEGNGDSIVIDFDAGPGEAVSVSVDGADRDKAEKLPVGAIATVECTSILDVLGVQVLARCRLV